MSFDACLHMHAAPFTPGHLTRPSRARLTSPPALQRAGAAHAAACVAWGMPAQHAKECERGHRVVPPLQSAHDSGCSHLW